MKQDKQQISNSTRLVYPADKITKADVAQYYNKIYPYLMSKVQNRILTIKRFHENINSESFFQRNPTVDFPVSMQGRKGILINDRNELTFLVNKSAFEFYVGMNTIDTVHPDKIVIDLDPPKGSPKLAVEAAKDIKGILDKINIKSYLMTTGSNGFHVVIPLKTNYSYLETRKFAKDLGQLMEKIKRDKYTTMSSHKGREFHLLIDYARNGLNQVMIAPYSLKGKPGAPIAAPVRWDELNNKAFNSKSITIRNIFTHVKTNPWQGYSLVNNNLHKASILLKALLTKS